MLKYAGCLMMSVWLAFGSALALLPVSGYAQTSDQNFDQEMTEFLQDILSLNPSPRYTSLQRKIDGQLSVSGPRRSQYARMNELVTYLVFLNSRIRFLVENNAVLSDFVRNHAADRVEHMTRLEQLAKEQEDIFLSYDSPGRPFHQSKNSIEEIYQTLKSAESILLTHLKNLQGINDRLRTLKLETVAFIKIEERISGKELNRKIQDMSDRLKMKEDLIEAQRAQLSEIRIEFDQMKLGLDIFRDRLRETNQKMDGMVKNFAEASLDLYERNQDLADKREHVASLETQLNETQERLQLVQRIIQEKDDHIQDLEKQVIEIQTDMHQAGSGQGVDQLRDEMNSLLADLRGQIEDGQLKIAQLEKKFRDMALVNAQMESEIMKRNVVISVLEKQVGQKNDMISDLERGFRVKHEKIIQMKDVVKIYQMKLKETTDILKERESEILQLQNDRLTGFSQPGESLIRNTGGEGERADEFDSRTLLFLSRDGVRLKSIAVANALNLLLEK